MISFLRLAAFLWVAALVTAPTIAPAAEAMPMGDWEIRAQGCAGCTDTKPVGELAGSTISISSTYYVDSVLGTDICPGAPVLRTTRTGPLAEVAGPAVITSISAFSGSPTRSAPASRIDVACSIPAKPPYTGQVLARLVYVPPSTLLYLWADDVLLFTRVR